MENVLGLSDSFISCNRDDMALFKVETHFPFLCPFVECVKVFLECSCVYLRLKSYIHYGVISKESNCRSNIVWNVVNVKKEIGRDQVQNLEGLLMLQGLQKKPRPLLVLFVIDRLRML